MKRAAYRVRQVVGVFDDEIMLGYGHRYSRDIDFLKAVSAEQRHGHVARNRHKRHAVEVRVRYARDEVCRARTRGRYRHADLARRFGVALGGVRRALLVRGEDLSDFRLAINRVEQVNDLSAGIPEHRRSVLFEQAFDYYFRAFEFHAYRCLVAFFEYWIIIAVNSDKIKPLPAMRVGDRFTLLTISARRCRMYAKPLSARIIK